MDFDLGPLSVLYCWQSFLLAMGVATATHGIKAVIDVTSGGTAVRQKRILLNRIVLPSTPIVVGVLGATVIPMHPEALITYIQAQHIVGWRALLIQASYGAMIGQLADYVWHRVSGFQADLKQKREEKRAGIVGNPPEGETTLHDPPHGTS